MNLRSPASGRNVSRVDISIPAPTRCFLPREQDSLSLSLSRPRLVLLLPLAQDESQPPRNTPILYEKARAYTHIRIRTYAQSRVSEREEREHVLFSLSLLLASFSPFLLHPALSLLLHAPLHSFFLVKKLISLSTFLIHSVLYVRGKSWTWVRSTRELGPPSWTDGSRRNRASRVTPCFASCFRRRRAAFHARSALPVFPFLSAPPLRASLSPFPFCFPARFRPLPATLIGKASKWTRSKCINNY